MLLSSPGFVGQHALGLYVPGEPRIHSFALAKPVTLWASPANAGAAELADELAATFAGLTVSTAEEPSFASRASGPWSTRRLAPRAGDATHMLLYLNEDTWSDERLAEQVRQAREDRLPIVMAHENGPDKGGVPFSRFFETTPQESDSLSGAAIPPCPMPSTSPSNAPQELIAGGLYKDLAKSCYPGRHHEAAAVPPSACHFPRLTPRGVALCLSVGVARAPGKGPRRDSGPADGGPPPLEEPRLPRRWRPL